MQSHFRSYDPQSIGSSLKKAYPSWKCLCNAYEKKVKKNHNEDEAAPQSKARKTNIAVINKKEIIKRSRFFKFNDL